MNSVQTIYEFIKNKIKEKKPEILFAPGDYFNTLVLYTSEGISRALKYAYDLLYQSFYHKATGDILYKKALDHEIPFNTGAFAEGIQRFGRNENAEQMYVIPKGTQVATSAYTRLAHKYRTTEEGFINIGQAAVDIPIEATFWGSDYNKDADNITTMIDSVPGVEWTTNPEPVYGGQDHDEEEEIRKKVLGYIRNIGRATIGALGYRASVVPGVMNLAIDENPQGSIMHPTVDPMMRYHGEWSADEEEKYHYGEAMITEEAEAYVDFYFEGTYIHPVIWSGSGVADLYIDDEFVDAISLEEDSSNMYQVEDGKHYVRLQLRNGELVFDGFKVFNPHPRDAVIKIYLDSGAGMISWDILKEAYTILNTQWRACGIRMFLDRMRMELVDIEVKVLWERGAQKTEAKSRMESEIATFIAMAKPGERIYICNIMPILLGITVDGTRQVKCAEVLTPDFTLKHDKVYRLNKVIWHEDH